MARILIIDDVSAIRVDIRRALCPPLSAQDLMRQLIDGRKEDVFFQHVIDEAAQGLEGVEKVRHAVQQGAPYDLILLDMMMPPGIDGRETLRRIREIDPKCPVIICTAFTEVTAQELAQVNGGVEPPMLYKPFDTTHDLVKFVDAVLAEKKA